MRAMAEKRINENPRITDTIIFDLPTPGADGCFTADPYKVDKVTIYYVERSFQTQNWGEYDKATYDPALLEKVVAAMALACSDPTPTNIAAAQQAQNELAATTQINKFYYNDAVVVNTVGTAENPAWLSTDTTDSPLVLVSEDADGNPQFGHFTYSWSPQGSVREGDYFICWTWTPLPAGDTLSDHVSFTIYGDPRAVITIPSHLTDPQKYGTLLERYLPDMYKQYVSDADLTPNVTDKLNLAIADGFTFMENLANQLIDLYDANALHESLLVYLSNLFNLRLKSNDPTLWRRQIKEAVPLFKKKGTLAGLKDAFSQAGMTLNKLTRLWQVVSPYTWQESFKVKSSPTFRLAKVPILPIDPNNFGLWLRRHGTTEYVPIDADNIEFETDSCGLFTHITWIGDEKSINPLPLYQGDFLRILYQYAVIPVGQQPIEDYIRSLYLADTRDEADQDYPPKNWNVRIIEEDDPLFNLIVPVRHPFHEDIIFGQVRTEFPFSENIFNMEEYNGSTRDTTDPCLMDKAFLDPCGGCLSSKYAIDVSVENLSDERIVEVRDILKEYTPFHAVPHALNLDGTVNEYVLPPVEEIEFLMTVAKDEIVLSGDANPFFTRIIEDGLTISKVTRDELAAQNVVVTSDTGTLYSDHISIVVPEDDLGRIGLDVNNNVLEVLAPSSNYGTYLISSVDGHIGVVEGDFLEPLNQSMFTFRLSNITYSTSTAIIRQKNLIKLSDDNVSFFSYGVRTLWDFDNTPSYIGGSWQVLIPEYSSTPYDIAIMDTDDMLVLVDDGTLPTDDISGVAYTLLDDSGNEIATSTSGMIEVSKRALVDLNDSNVADIHDYVVHGDYMVYGDIEYKVTDFSGSQFYVEGYDLGDAAGVSVNIKRRLIEQGIGYFGYSGLKLETTTNYEAELGILNGVNPPYTDPNYITDNNLFKENFLVRIFNDYYKIAEIDGTTITLSGTTPYDVPTLAAGGSLSTFSISKFSKGTVSIKFTVFDQLDRRGKDPVIEEILSEVTDDVAVFALSLPPNKNFSDSVMQDEGLSFTVEYRDGSTSQGEL